MTNKEIIQGLNDINYMLSYTEMYLPEQYPEHKKILDAAIEGLDTKTATWTGGDCHNEWWGSEYTCSKCGGTMIGRTRFCAECGCKMENGE